MLWAVVAAVAALSGAGDSSRVSLSGDATRLGHIDLVATGPAGTPVQIVELVDGRPVDVPAVRTRTVATATVEWTCERTRRTFRAIAGGRVTKPYVARTPGCRHRLYVGVPHAVSRGKTLRIRFRDRWRIGNTSARLCVRPARRSPRCEIVAIPGEQFLANRVFAVGRPGAWTVRVRTERQRIRRRVRVRPQPTTRFPALPSILLTGDSLMLEQTPALRQASAGRATVIGDVYPSAGLLKPFVAEWNRIPALHVRALRPDATVLTLGIGDAAPIEGPKGELACCGKQWSAGYARLAREVMRTYSRGGRAAVVWMNVPFPRDADPDPLVRINGALGRAARGLPRVEVLDLARLLTPGHRYRQTLMRHGRAVQVRSKDGIHLTAAGARIAVQAARRALARLGVPT